MSSEAAARIEAIKAARDAAENGDGNETVAPPVSDDAPAVLSVEGGKISTVPPPGVPIRTEINTKQTFTAEAGSAQKPTAVVPPPRFASCVEYPAVIQDLSEWLEFWRKWDWQSAALPDDENPENFLMIIVRERDGLQLPNTPPAFRVPNAEPLPLGEWPFNTSLNVVIGHCQSIAGNSGGRFRITLRDGGGDLVSQWATQVPHTWRGPIPNPPAKETPAAAANPERAPKEKDFLTQMTEFASKQKQLKEALGVKDGAPQNSPLAAVEAAAAATIITKVSETITEVTQAAANAKPASEDKRGMVARFADNVVNGDEGQTRFWKFLDKITDMGAAVADNWMDARRARIEAENAKHNPDAAAPPKQLAPGLYGYILDKCERRETVRFGEDEELQKFAETDAVAYKKIKGGLRVLSPEAIVKQFLKGCAERGLTARAEKVLQGEHVPQWLAKLIESAKDS